MLLLRTFLVAVSIVAACLTTASAQDYPTRTVKIIVPFGPGGPADVYARFVGAHLQEMLQQSFVIENRPGAGSIIGTAEVARAAPDGYTLLMMSNTHTVNETLIVNKSFQLMRDFVPVAPVNSSDLVMVVHPSVPVSDLQQFIALVRANPGAFNYASSGTGTPYHMAAELFKTMTGTSIAHVAHRGSGEARNNIIGGHVHMMFDAVSTMASNVASGQVRALGTSGKVRTSVLPDIPTIGEAGVPDYEATIWLGIMAPKGTPQLIVAKLNEEINKLLTKPAIKEAWAKQGVVPIVMSPAAFANYLRSDVEKWAEVIKTAGIKTQ